MPGIPLEGVRTAGLFPVPVSHTHWQDIHASYSYRKAERRLQQSCHFCLTPKWGQHQRESTQNMGETALPSLETELFHHQLSIKSMFWAALGLWQPVVHIKL